MSRVLRLFLALAVLTVSVCFIACGARGGADKPVVTVSLQPQKYMLEKIVGDAYNVRCLLSNGGNPESYDPSFANLLNTEKSVAFLRMGNIGFEEAIVDKVHESNPSLPIYDTSRGIVPVVGTHGHDAADPHVWTSVRNVKVIARNMCEAMSEVDPSNAGRFRANLEAFEAELDELDARISAELAPLRGSAFLVWHPSLSYFARDYGLRQIVVGGAEHKEMSLPDLRRSVDEAVASGAEVLFVQKETDGRHAEAIGADLPVRHVEINPLSEDWPAQMLLIANSLAHAGND